MRKIFLVISLFIGVNSLSQNLSIVPTYQPPLKADYYNMRGKIICKDCDTNQFSEKINPKELRKETVESITLSLKYDEVVGVKNLYINNYKEDQEADEILYDYFIVKQQDKSVFIIKVKLLTKKMINFKM